MADKATKCLDLPSYLKSVKARELQKVKTVSMIEKIIEMPEDLLEYNISGGVVPVLVRILGIELPNKQRYYVKGKAVALIGINILKDVRQDKGILLTESSVRLVNGTDTYIGLTTIYPNKMGGSQLYATKTLYRYAEEIKRLYPEFIELGLRIKENKGDVAKGYEGIEIPNGYVEASDGVNFKEKVERNQRTDNAQYMPVVEKPNIVEQPKVEQPKPKDMSNDKWAYTVLGGNKGKKQELENRREIKEIPNVFHELEDVLKDSMNKVDSKITELEEYNGTHDIEDDIKYAYNQIKSAWRRAKVSGTPTGKALFKEVLERFLPDYKDKKAVSGKTVIDEALDSVVDIPYEVWYTGNHLSQENKLLDEIVANRETIYIQIIDYLLSLRSKLVSAYEYGKTLGIDVYSIMKLNPYYLTIIDNRLTIEELDKLAMFYNIDKDKREIKVFRNAAYLHNTLLDTNNPLIKENTIIEKRIITSNFESGYILNKKMYELLMQYGMIVDNEDIGTYQYYLNKNIVREQFELPTDKWKAVKKGGTEKFVRRIEGEDKERAIQDYIDVGLGLEQKINGKLYLMDYNYAQKEKYIIERMYSLMEDGHRPHLSAEEIEHCISEFEDMKAREFNIPKFSLEERQKDAVRTLYNPVMCLTGPAGSGKTTTAEALVYALENLLGVDEDEIMFCAPTGKAANRLKEIVKRATRTINSLFSVGGESFTLLKDKNMKKKDEIRVLIVDESSMINLELMYNMVSKIANGTRVIFLGDREQLPPIGAGKPFANLLTFLPCVVLNVTKRASDSSGITRNAKKIIYESDKAVLDDLEQTDDFRLITETKENTLNLIKLITNYHLGNYVNKAFVKTALKNLGTDLTPDDIQIITPVNKYDWGTRTLNRELQDIFNPQKGMALRFEKERKTSSKEGYYVDYRIGDRVIHLENQNDATRLIKSDGYFKKAYDETGVMNGDVGKVEGFYMASQLMFEDDDKDLREEFDGGPSTIYVAVEYSDVDSLGATLNYLILYKAEKLMDKPDSKNVMEVSSYDLKKLDLAYALTVHKLQGSQAKLIICVFFKVGYGDFISRNMIYTAITRAKLGAYVIGDVLGQNSAITTGRRVEQVSKRLTITDMLYEE